MTNLTEVMTPHPLGEGNEEITHRQSRMNASIYDQRSHKMKKIPPDIMTNPLLKVENFPGKLCMNRLVQAHILSKLDADTYYPAKYNASAVTRAHIVRNVIPFGAIASRWLAAWIWLGGEFPDHIDVASSTHYRSILFGREVRSTTRQIHSSCIIEFPHLLVTSPARTMCDIACSDLRRENAEVIEHTLHRLAFLCKVSEHDCIELMRTNTRQPRYTSGVNLLIRSFASIEDNVAQCNAFMGIDDENTEPDIIENHNDEENHASTGGERHGYQLSS